MNHTIKFINRRPLAAILVLYIYEQENTQITKKVIVSGRYLMDWKRSLPSQVDFAEIASPPSAAFLSQPPHPPHMSRRLSPNNSYPNCKINSNFVWWYINLYQTHRHNNTFITFSIICYTALFVVSPYCNLYLVL